MEISFNNLYKILKDHRLENVYINLLENKLEQSKEAEIIRILSLAAILIDRDEIEYKKLGYYIILKYSIVQGDYVPLYEVSYKLLNIPVVVLLDRIMNIKKIDSVLSELYDVIKEECRDGEKYYTGKQKKLKLDFFENDTETSVIAPTSFGKTELIKEYILKNFNDKNICVVLPSKAMINQLRIDLMKMFKNIEGRPRIITHYDMNISTQNRNVFIYTQERLFKSVYDRKMDIKFDTLLVDEAHNLFKKDERNKLLARIIILLKNQNPDMTIKYFSPVIENNSHINYKYMKHKYNIEKNLVIKPIIKIEEFFFINFIDNEKKIYDQFFNHFIPTGYTYKNEFEYVLKESGKTNIIYLNKPRDCIDKAFGLAEYIDKIDGLDECSQELKKYIHEDYDLAELVKKGIIYHNGIVPENVRLYLENVIRSNNSKIKYVFATSTLLEGVNMPFDNMFIMDTRKGNGNMTYHDLKNLIGRVNRYGLVFDKENFEIHKLLPSVHFVKTKEKEKNNFEEFIKNNLKVESKSAKRDDIIENPLLKDSNESDEKEIEIIQNLEKTAGEDKKVMTEVGKLCIENNITEFDIKKHEETISNKINEMKNTENKYSVIDLINKIFLEDIEYKNNDFEFVRLRNEKARAFYNMFIGWRRSNITYNEMVKKMLGYWKKENVNYMYIGSQWGECKRKESDRIANYVRLITKDDKQKVNLAIKKIKIENNFIDYKIMKYIEILYKLSLIEKSEFDEIKYGTSDKRQIFFQNDGLSQELSKKIVNEYSKYILDIGNEEYKINPEILDSFIENNILRVELEYYL